MRLKWAITKPPKRTSMNITTSIYIQASCTANMVLSSLRSMTTVLAAGISWNETMSYGKHRTAMYVLAAAGVYILLLEVTELVFFSQVFCSIP